MYEFMDDHPFLGALLALFVILFAAALKIGSKIIDAFRAIAELFRRWP